MSALAMQKNADRLSPADLLSVEGVVVSVSGLGIEIADDLGALEMDARVEVETSDGWLLCEIAGLSEKKAFALPFGPLAGVRRGARVKFLRDGGAVDVSDAWLGRVVDGLGRPIDGKGPIPVTGHEVALRGKPPAPAMRARLGPTIDFGVKALDAFAPTRAGQRMGIFSASGVGKSALLAMIARNTDCDVSVIALIGERGREVRDFIEDYLGEEGLARSVVIVATSDEPAMMRREAGFLALTVSEYFRDARDHAHVLCLMDSLTRIAMAQREISLAAGEPPATKGYTPSVFATLPALVERAGPGPDGDGAGFITGLFSVLVEGDDHDEPVADAARAILDGHIVLDRRIAERGRFPAVNILRTISRSMPGALGDDERALVTDARAVASEYEDMREMIRIGAYRPGANPVVDRAIAMHPALEEFLAQDMGSRSRHGQTFDHLRAIFEREEQA